ncbi:hypothetical protein ACIOHS_35610 [Streptomyces sp. NPDC088253]|uniref:hypothetical protein n=1 Tax=Streptomyces sp. NPDC088253 TaxID=3365846 RepID=UPI0037F632F1
MKTAPAGLLRRRALEPGSRRKGPGRPGVLSCGAVVSGGDRPRRSETPGSDAIIGIAGADAVDGGDP